SLRLYEMFMGPFDQMIAWDTKGIIGVRRFLDRFWNLVLSCINNKKSNKEIQSAFNKLIKKITEDLDNAKFNTAVAAFMEFSNLVSSNQDKTGKDVIEKLLILFAPFASHITEELWSLSGFKKSVHLQKWPVYNPKLIKEEKITLVIQINGKVRDKIEVAVDISENKAKEIALSQEKIKKGIADKKIKKVVFIKNKLINIVV
ncbi:class I tRNA ligase family protein, partial [Patescibacteria group bacterium]|nr:class I tRNA ligase family protein [Patescibacteria group bacterium]